MQHHPSVVFRRRGRVGGGHGDTLAEERVVRHTQSHDISSTGAFLLRMFFYTRILR
jgi:hypothetical protein